MGLVVGTVEVLRRVPEAGWRGAEPPPYILQTAADWESAPRSGRRGAEPPPYTLQTTAGRGTCTTGEGDGRRLGVCATGEVGRLYRGWGDVV